MGTKVKVGSKAYIFHDQSTGITIKKGEIKELTPQQYNSKRIRSAINGGHLVITNENIENARKYSRFAVVHHSIPIAPHLLFPQFLDDTLGEDRQTAMFMNHVLLTKCVQLWVFGSSISEGMEQEIRWAKRRHMPIRYFTEEMEEVV